MVPKRPNKRKKGKGNLKKQQAIEKKLNTLLENLNPVPFIPSKTVDFTKHEKLLKRLGLWDFFHIEFDRIIRIDLVAELIVNYDPKLRCSYVNEFRIAVNRADLARAFKLPVKKEKCGNLMVSDGVDLDSEALSEESISFIEGFVSNWVLLHEDTWMMPTEVLTWTKAIKDGHPEKVDWAGLFWFMVEKELMKGEQLVDCYYASHLQYLIKSQREEAMMRKPEEVVSKEEQDTVDLDAEEVVVRDEQDRVELDVGEVALKEQDKGELDAEVKEEEDGGNEVGDVKTHAVNEDQEQKNDVFKGPNVELTLGQDVGEKDKLKDAEMMDVEECNKEQEGEEQGQWLLDGKTNVGEHFLQRCNVEDASGFGGFEESKEEGDELDGDEEEGEEEEAEDGYDVGPNDDSLEGDGLTGNFLHAMETSQIPFGSQEHLHEDSVDLVDDRNALQQMAAGGPSFYGNNGKREIDHEHDISHHALNGSNKRLRIDGPWDPKPMDFGTCMEQMQHLMHRARFMYAEKEQAQEQANMNHQILLNELQKRDDVIEHLHRSKCEEIQKRDAEMYRLQRELYLMGNLLEDYRKALKLTNKAFADYRQKFQLPEEPIYKDAGPGGVMLTTAEIEKQGLEREEEFRMNCLILEQKAKEAEDAYAIQFGDYLDKVIWLDKRLQNVENSFKELFLKPRVLDTEEKVMEIEEGVVETEERVIETEERVVETEDEVVETEEKVVETEDEVVETEDKVMETEDDEVVKTDGKVVETSECPPSG
ncbi:hypothetical protein ACH5RR_028646 [Cinchona calisaya]|uniref:Uncharacterized protein n=1 Tax=Cinchona calisaya TaxID=153742 RepID=A0ABD2YTB5_9GENT